MLSRSAAPRTDWLRTISMNEKTSFARIDIRIPHFVFSVCILIARIVIFILLFRMPFLR